MLNRIILLLPFLAIPLIVSSSSLLYAQENNFDIVTGISNSSKTKLDQLEKLMEENTGDIKSTDRDIDNKKDVTTWRNYTSSDEFTIEYLSNWNVNDYAQFIQSPDGFEQFSYYISYPNYNNIKVLTRISALDDLKSSDIHIFRSLLSNLDFSAYIDGERASSYGYEEKDDRGYDVLIFHKFLTLHDGKLYKFTFKDVTYENMQRMIYSIRWIN